MKYRTGFVISLMLMVSAISPGTEALPTSVLANSKALTSEHIGAYLQQSFSHIFRITNIGMTHLKPNHMLTFKRIVGRRKFGQLQTPHTHKSVQRRALPWQRTRLRYSSHQRRLRPEFPLRHSENPHRRRQWVMLKSDPCDRHFKSEVSARIE